MSETNRHTTSERLGDRWINSGAKQVEARTKYMASTDEREEARHSSEKRERVCDTAPAARRIRRLRLEAWASNSIASDLGM